MPNPRKYVTIFKMNHASGSKTLQIKLLVSFTLTVSMMIIILSLVLFLYFEGLTIDRIYVSESNNLFQAGVSTRLMREMAQGIAIQMYNDHSLSPLFFIPPQDPVDIYNTLSSFKKYRDLLPYIHSIYIYNPSNNTFYINSPAKSGMIQPKTDFFDKEIISLLKDKQLINSQRPVPRIILEPGILQSRINETGVYSFLYNLSGVSDSGYPGNIVINISENWVRDIIDSLDKDPGIKALIIDESDRLLISSTGKDLLNRAGIYPYLRDSLSRDGRSGYLVTEVSGVKTFLVYSRIETLDWIFVKLIPYNCITKDLFAFRKNLLLIASGILFTGSTLAVLLAKKLYKPIASLSKRLHTLEEQRKGDLPVLREYNMKRLLTESEDLSRYEQIRFLKELELNWETEDQLCLLLLEIDHYMKFREMYSIHQQNLLKLAVIDSAARVIREIYQCDGFDEGANQLLLLINVKQDTPKRSDKVLTDLIIRVQEIVQHSCSLSISACFSRPLGKIGELNQLQGTLKNLIRHKYLAGTGCILKESESHQPQQEFRYPGKKEEKFMEALNQGNGEKAYTLYSEIMRVASSFGYNAVLTTRNSLAFEINKTINQMKKMSILNFQFQFPAFFARLNAIETLADTHALFRELINQLVKSIEKRNSMMNYELVLRVEKLIGKEYADTNLGIATLADKLKISAAYLGRLFHKFTGKSMTEYINETRIAQAKTLLETSSLSISEIMLHSGFSNKTHFYSIFKKYNGTTPKSYRQNSTLPL